MSREDSKLERRSDREKKESFHLKLWKEDDNAKNPIKRVTKEAERKRSPKSSAAPTFNVASYPPLLSSAPQMIPHNFSQHFQYYSGDTFSTVSALDHSYGILQAPLAHYPTPAMNMDHLIKPSPKRSTLKKSTEKDGSIPASSRLKRTSSSSKIIHGGSNSAMPFPQVEPIPLPPITPSIIDVVPRFHDRIIPNAEIQQSAVWIGEPSWEANFFASTYLSLETVSNCSFYQSVSMKSVEFKVFDHVVLRMNGNEDDADVVARVLALLEEDGEKKVLLEWYCSKVDLEQHLQQAKLLEDAARAWQQELAAMEDGIHMKRRGRPPKKRRQHIEETLEFLRLTVPNELFALHKPYVTLMEVSVMSEVAYVEHTSKIHLYYVPPSKPHPSEQKYFFYRRSFDHKMCVLALIKSKLTNNGSSSAALLLPGHGIIDSVVDSTPELDTPSKKFKYEETYAGSVDSEAVLVPMEAGPEDFNPSTMETNYHQLQQHPSVQKYFFSSVDNTVHPAQATPPAFVPQPMFHYTAHHGRENGGFDDAPGIYTNSLDEDYESPLEDHSQSSSYTTNTRYSGAVTPIHNFGDGISSAPSTIPYDDLDSLPSSGCPTPSIYDPEFQMATHNLADVSIIFVADGFET